MATMVAAALATVAAYAVGIFPTAGLVGRAHGRDVTREGSGNPGASNVYRLAGRRAALVVFGGDFLKGVLAAAGGWALGGKPLALACGAAAVVGHCFPVTRGFRGGKGVATGAGFVTVVEPLLALLAAVLWTLVAAATRKASPASLAVVVAVPVGVLALRGAAWESVVVLGTGALIVVRHAGNVVRLMRGEERSLP